MKTLILSLLLSVSSLAGLTEGDVLSNYVECYENDELQIVFSRAETGYWAKYEAKFIASEVVLSNEVPSYYRADLGEKLVLEFPTGTNPMEYFVFQNLEIDVNGEGSLEVEKWNDPLSNQVKVIYQCLADFTF